jgi:hypothetical protein
LYDYNLEISLGPNPGGIGVYNAEVENYLLQFLLVEKNDKPTTTLIHQLPRPWDSIELASLVEGGPHDQPQIRGRAATFDVYKIRTHVGSKVIHDYKAHSGGIGQQAPSATPEIEKK